MSLLHAFNPWHTTWQLNALWQRISFLHESVPVQSIRHGTSAGHDCTTPSHAPCALQSITHTTPSQLPGQVDAHPQSGLQLVAFSPVVHLPSPHTPGQS
jgi:hypothetical protein